MPAKNEVKLYVEEGIYHLYNRGVEKRLIFLDKQDYAVFLSYLKAYLLPKDEKQLRVQFSSANISSEEKEKISTLLRLKNFYQEIILLAYNLMPNHFHFLLKQKSARAIVSFMTSLLTRYTMYFNKKYKRVGPLYQGSYKGVLVETDAQLLELSRYIHRNSFMEFKGLPLRDYSYSSYPNYLGVRHSRWLNTQEILSFFSQAHPNLSYEVFVEESEDRELIVKLLIEED